MADSSAGDAASPPPPPASGGASSTAKLQAQLKKLTDANGKYKNLLKLAKERIQQQEEELESARHGKEDAEERLERERRNREEAERAAAEAAAAAAESGNFGGSSSDEVHNVVQVCRRVKVAAASGSSPADASSGSTAANGGTSTGCGPEEIWALLEVEVIPMNDMMMDTAASGSGSSVSRRYREWKKFTTETELQDFIRRDTGEPLKLPPFSLSPDQSAQIQQEAAAQVSQVTEEFRRFRVRSELARKQADAQIRDLQSNKFQSATRRIEGQDVQFQLEQARNVTGELERMKTELAAQEAHWKEAYDVLLAENNALKSSGSEALLASQWRQRYETCVKEKEALEGQLQAAQSKDSSGDKYEAKYRDLKESFRLYRKKAKEIFESQERGGGGAAASLGVPPAMMSSLLSTPASGRGTVSTGMINDASSAEARLSYLKNLMVNYLTADQTVRGHMESAIGTVLQFTPEEVQQIEEKKKEANEAWF